MAILPETWFRTSRAGIILAFLLLSACAHRAARDHAVPPRLTGCYSDLEYHDESGDLLGTEIWILFSRDGYFAVYQESEGEPSVPVLLPVETAGQTVRFTVPGQGAFKGRIEDGVLTGDFPSIGRRLVLPRTMSYWQ